MNTTEGEKKEKLQDWCSFVVLYFLDFYVVVVDNDKPKKNLYKCAGGTRKKREDLDPPQVDISPIATALREIKTETSLDLKEIRLEFVHEFPMKDYSKFFFSAEITEEEFQAMKKGHDIKLIAKIPTKNLSVLRDQFVTDHYIAIMKHTNKRRQQN